MVVSKKPKTQYSTADKKLFALLTRLGWKLVTTDKEQYIFHLNGYWIGVSSTDKQAHVFLMRENTKLFSFYTNQADINPVHSFLTLPTPGEELTSIDPKSLKPQLIKY